MLALSFSRKIANYVAQAAESKCELVCLPECFDYLRKAPPGTLDPLELASALDGRINNASARLMLLFVFYPFFSSQTNKEV